ncbi:malto-oligosyltrehalose synthase [Roseixanthobacter pseudopolyaromaticivorans]|uniref:malto-oligosyltrehalose synthase n=1 Tax=Xanthobacteraceae TaxID=335928 RepID=UPI0037261BB4
MTAPRATVRLQFHRDFPLDAAIPLVDYFADLGISHIYSSPLLTSRPGSRHGYDTVDHGTLDPELGGEAALRRLVAALRARGMGLILDIVPNHMGVGGADNPVWLDVLEWGLESTYRDFFDIDWSPPDTRFKGKVVAPFLDRSYGEALKAGAIRLAHDSARGTFHFRHHDHVFPVCPRTYGDVLSASGAEPQSVLDVDLATLADPVAPKRDVQATKERLALALTREGPQIVAAALEAFDSTTEAGQARLHALLEKQNFRLAWWRVANDELNWRRFFDITGLAGVKVERGEVFEIVHALVFQLYADGLIDGLRIDHVDGIADPGAYCRQLKRKLDALEAQRPHDTPAGGYVIVEKILHTGEAMPASWRMDGTTGYDFMDEVSAVLHDGSSDDALEKVWSQAAQDSGTYAAQMEAARRQILREGFGTEMDTAARALHEVAQQDLDTRDITLASIRRSLRELVVAFPVYRTYADASGRSAQDWTYFSQALTQARRRLAPIDHPVLDLLDRWLGGEAPRALGGDMEQAGTRAYAIAKFQQLTAPIAAKAVEDTVFYRYGRLLSRNEVGSDPGQLALPVRAFHELAQARGTHFPDAMLATATHDHKRGEDSRMRLAVLSEIPQEWSLALADLQAAALPLREALAPLPEPSPVDEVMLYQALIGAWPLDLGPEDGGRLHGLLERMASWQIKALREAKRHTNWVFPNTDYEAGCDNFLRLILTDGRGKAVRASLAAIVQRLAPAGALNGLAQIALKYTVPGVPDLYQGTEFWDFSLVDPDNRRPVDYRARATALGRLESPAACLPHWRDGRVKQSLIATLLRARAAHPDLFLKGSYLPLDVAGPATNQAIAFARQHGELTLVMVANRLCAGLLGTSERPLVPNEALQETDLQLPAQLAGTYSDLASGRAFSLAETTPLATLLERMPVAVLLAAP